MVSKIQLNEKQLEKNGLPIWDNDFFEEKAFQDRNDKISRRCLKCGRWFTTFKKTNYVLCSDCGKI